MLNIDIDLENQLAEYIIYEACQFVLISNLALA